LHHPTHHRPVKARTTATAVSTSRSSPASAASSSPSSTSSSSSSSRPLSQPPNPLHSRPKSKGHSVFLRPPRSYAEYSARSSPKSQKTYRVTPGLPSFQVRHSPTSNKTTLFPSLRSAPSSPLKVSPINNRLSLSDLTLPGSSVQSEDSSDSSDSSQSSSESDSSDCPSQPASGRKYTLAAAFSNSPMTKAEPPMSTPQESEHESIKVNAVQSDPGFYICYECFTCRMDILTDRMASLDLPPPTAIHRIYHGYGP